MVELLLARDDANPDPKDFKRGRRPLSWVLRIDRVSVATRRLVQVQLDRPQLNEAASGSEVGQMGI